jgi:catechol 2,3-dioxygenase-like lactoylglutathione lyase family enzyme
MKTITAIPVFNVKDVNATLPFYTQTLGFVQSFRYGTYVGLKLGKCEIHLCPPGDHQRSPGGCNAYFICDEVDEYHAKIKAAGAHPKSEPMDRMYGMRDFAVQDPDGNLLSFGCDCEHE